tara:strand:- start:59 stop:448 length:390 start_codon:yes stop_codon:yes gene_type:complete
MAIQRRKKIKPITINNRTIPKAELKKVKTVPMPKVKKSRKKVLSRDKIIGIMDFTVYLINKRAVTMTWTWLKARLKEPSTYQGVTAIAGAIGVSIQPDLYESIAALMVAIIGVIQTIKKEKEDDKPKSA